MCLIFSTHWLSYLQSRDTGAYIISSRDTGAYIVLSVKVLHEKRGLTLHVCMSASRGWVVAAIYHNSVWSWLTKVLTQLFPVHSTLPPRPCESDGARRSGRSNTECGPRNVRRRPARGLSTPWAKEEEKGGQCGSPDWHAYILNS